MAAESFWVEHLQWDYGVDLHQEGNNIAVAFQPLLLADIMASVKVVHSELDQVPLKEASQELCLTFGPHPNTKMADYNFEKEVECLPFQAQFGGTSLKTENTRPNLLI